MKKYIAKFDVDWDWWFEKAEIVEIDTIEYKKWLTENRFDFSDCKIIWNILKCSYSNWNIYNSKEEAKKWLQEQIDKYNNKKIKLESKQL